MVWGSGAVVCAKRAVGPTPGRHSAAGRYSILVPTAARRGVLTHVTCVFSSIKLHQQLHSPHHSKTHPQVSGAQVAPAHNWPSGPGPQCGCITSPVPCRQSHRHHNSVFALVVVCCFPLRRPPWGSTASALCGRLKRCWALTQAKAWQQCRQRRSQPTPTCWASEWVGWGCNSLINHTQFPVSCIEHHTQPLGPRQPKAQSKGLAGRAQPGLGDTGSMLLLRKHTDVPWCWRHSLGGCQQGPGDCIVQHNTAAVPCSYLATRLIVCCPAGVLPCRSPLKVWDAVIQAISEAVSALAQCCSHCTVLGSCHPGTRAVHVDSLHPHTLHA